MIRQSRPDPFVVEVFGRNPETMKPWVKAEPLSHNWTARLPVLKACAHAIDVRIVDKYGCGHHGRRRLPSYCNSIEARVGGATQGFAINGNGLGAALEGPHEIMRLHPIGGNFLAGNDVVPKSLEAAGKI